MKNHLRKESRSSIHHNAEDRAAIFPDSLHDLKGLSGKKIKALVQALRVHQIELELQNNELRRTQLELQATRDKYIDLYDFSPVGYITTSADGTILNANRAVSTLLKTEKHELMGELFFHFVTIETKDLLYLHRKKLYETDAPQSCELVMMKSDGSMFDAQLNSILVADSHGDFTQIRTTVFDISERKKMEKALRESEAQLRLFHKMVAVGTMAGGIAHDFNNLLMVMLGNIELAENWARGKSKAAMENLDTARGACIRAAGIIKQILHVSRQKNSPRKPIKMTSVVQASLARVDAVSAGIEIKREFFAENDTIIADPGQIHQVLINLCDNALQAMEEKGGRLTIGLTNAAIKEDAAFPHNLLPGNYLKFSVSDTGPGIEPRILDQIFTPYFTTKDNGKGSGLGLAVVYGILLNHNGRIFVSTEKGEGTTFDMYFPVKEKENEA